MRRISGLILLGAAIGLVAPLCAAGPQAQNQARPPEGFRIIGNIYWVGGEYGSYLITTPQGHILHDTGTSEMHDVDRVERQEAGVRRQGHQDAHIEPCAF